MVKMFATVLVVIALLKTSVEALPDLKGVNNARGNNPLTLFDPEAATVLTKELAVQYANITELAPNGFYASGVWFDATHCKHGCPVTYSIRTANAGNRTLDVETNMLLSEILSNGKLHCEVNLADYDNGARFIIVKDSLSQFDLAHATSNSTHGLSIGHNTSIKGTIITVIIYKQAGLIVKAEVEDKKNEVDSDIIGNFRVKWFANGLFQNQVTRSNDSKQFALFLLQTYVLDDNHEGTFKGTAADDKQNYITSYIKVETVNLDMAVELATNRFEKVWKTDPNVSLDFKNQYQNLKQKNGLSHLDFYFLITSDAVDIAIVAIGNKTVVVFRTTQAADLNLKTSKSIYDLLANINTFRTHHGSPTITLDVDTSHQGLADLLETTTKHETQNERFGRENGENPSLFFFCKNPDLLETPIDKMAEFLKTVLNANTNSKNETALLHFLSPDVAVRRVDDVRNLREDILFAKKVGFSIKYCKDKKHLLIIFRFSPVPMIDDNFEWAYKSSKKLREGLEVNREKSLLLSLVAGTQVRDILYSKTDKIVTHAAMENQYAITTFKFRKISQKGFDDAITEALGKVIEDFEKLARKKEALIWNDPISNTDVEQISSKFIIVQESNQITAVSLAQMRCRSSDGVGFAYALSESEGGNSFDVAVSMAWEYPIFTPEFIRNFNLFYTKRANLHGIQWPESTEISYGSEEVAKFLVITKELNDLTIEIPDSGFGITRTSQFCYVFVSMEKLKSIIGQDSKRIGAANLAIDTVLALTKKYAIPYKVNSSLQLIRDDLLLIQNNIEYAYAQLCEEKEKPVNIGVAESTGGFMIVFQTTREDKNIFATNFNIVNQTLVESALNFHADKLATALLHGFKIDKMSGSLEGINSGFQASFTVDFCTDAADEKMLLINFVAAISAATSEDKDKDKTEMLHGTFKNVFGTISRRDKNNLLNADGIGYGSRCEGNKCAFTTLYYNKCHDKYLKKLEILVKKGAKIDGIRGPVTVVPGAMPINKTILSSLLRTFIGRISASGLGLFEYENSKIAVVYKHLRTVEVAGGNPANFAINALLAEMESCIDTSYYKSCKPMSPIKTLEESGIKFTPITTCNSLANLVLFTQSPTVTAKFFITENKDGVLVGIANQLYELEIAMLPYSVLNFARKVQGKAEVHVDMEKGLESDAEVVLNNLSQKAIGDTESVSVLEDKRSGGYSLVHQRLCETWQDIALKLAMSLECVNALIQKQKHLAVDKIQISIYTTGAKKYTAIVVCREYTWTRKLQEILENKFEKNFETRLVPTNSGVSGVTMGIENHINTLGCVLETGLYLLPSQNIGISIIKLDKYDQDNLNLETIFDDYASEMKSNVPHNLNYVESIFTESKNDFVQLSSGSAFLDWIQLTHKAHVKVGISFFLDKEENRTYLGIFYLENPNAKLLQTLIPQILKNTVQSKNGNQQPGSEQDEKLKAAFEPKLSEIWPMDKFPKARERGVLLQENVSRYFDIRSLNFLTPSQIFVEFVNSITRICSEIESKDTSFPYIIQANSDKSNLLGVDVDDETIRNIITGVGPVKIEVVQDTKRFAMFISFVQVVDNKIEDDRTALRCHMTQLVNIHVDNLCETQLDLAAGLVAKALSKSASAKPNEVYLTNRSKSNANMKRTNSQRNLGLPSNASSLHLKGTTNTNRREKSRIVIMENFAAIVIRSNWNSAYQPEILECLKAFNESTATKISRLLKKDCGFMLIQDHISVEEIVHMLSAGVFGVAIEATSVVYLFRIPNSYSSAMDSIGGSENKARKNSASLSALAAQVISIMAPVTEPMPKGFRSGHIKVDGLPSGTELKLFYFTDIWKYAGTQEQSIEKSMEILLKAIGMDTKKGAKSAKLTTGGIDINSMGTLNLDNLITSADLLQEIITARYVGFFGKDVPITVKQKSEKGDCQRILIGVYVPAFKSHSGQTLEYTKSHTSLEEVKKGMPTQKSSRNLKGGLR